MMVSIALAIASLASLLSLGAASPTAHGERLRNDEAETEYVIATTVSGPVRGFRSTVRGKLIDTYYGIPYTAPPTGGLRFSGSLPDPQPWTAVRDALVPSDQCLQATHQGKGGPIVVRGSEDCLYVNIHTPAPSTRVTTASLPVMLWIHGGSYRVGSGAIYNGENLATKDVIVVTFNYRLNALGFLSTEDHVMPGNYGMLDQIQAMKWVQRNIAYFGGDPQKVTIFGESAGGTSTSLHLVSPLASGLFRGAIMESGSSLSPWAFARPARRISHKQAASLIGDRVGCSTENSQAFLQCMLKVDAVSLVRAVLETTDEDYHGNVLMNPRVERDFGFLPKVPLDLLVSGDFNAVNTIRGFNSDEIGYFIDLNQLDKIASPEILRLFVERTLTLVNISDVQTITDNVVRHYSQNIPMTSIAYSQAIERFGSDIDFISGAINEAEIYSKMTNRDCYQYRFDVRPESSKQPAWVTAAHMDELKYVFGTLNTRSWKQQAVSDAVMRYWTNFAKTGDPNNDGALNAAIHSLSETRDGQAKLDEKAEDNNRIGTNPTEVEFTSVDEPAGGEVDVKGNPSTRWQPFDSQSHQILVFTEDGPRMQRFYEPEMTSSFYCFVKAEDNIRDSTCSIFG